MRRQWSPLEVLLIVVVLVLIICCTGLIVVSWIALQPEGATEPVLSGQMTVTGGAVFSEELRNSTSLQFKSLAFDIQNVVSKAFSSGELRHGFRSCQVLSFSQGSVVVTFDLWFHLLVTVKQVKQELEVGLQQIDTGGLMIDRNSIQITEKQDQTTGDPTTIKPTTVVCPPHQTSCRDQWTCVPINQLCDGVDDCPDGSDEDVAQCATACDGQFLLMGSSGSFRSANEAQPSYNSSSFCRWIIRVRSELSVQIIFQHFDTEEQSDTLRLYEGVGQKKRLTAELSGSTSPGTVWLLSDQSTVEFSSDEFNNLSGFSATYRAENTSNLSNEQKLTCSFEQGLCLWRQQLNDDGYWIRIRGPTFPPLTGPSVDHTFGNESGFYLVTPRSPGQFLRRFRIHSLRLSPSSQPACLHFWSHMFGEDVHQLTVFLFQWSPSDAAANVTTVFQREGNFGDTWNYGQVTLNQTGDVVVVFEALKKGGMWSDIALDDITLTSGHCGPAPPDPTTVPPPTTAPPTPPDCGGPFDLWEPNSTFTSPNYPQSYGNEAHCQWILHALKGRNIELHFLDFDLEATHDVVEVRDGTWPNSTFMGVFTGNSSPSPNLISTANQMTVWFFTDKSVTSRGFRANFTSGINLGSPEPCTAGQFQCDTGSCIHGNSQCDGVVDCPDASDEAECVILQINGSQRLKFKLIYSLVTACSLSWNSYLSNFTCQYLGYRSGQTMLLPALPEDSPFTNFSVGVDGKLQLSVSETCDGGHVVSLTCDNQPCGVRQVSNNISVLARAEGWRHDEGVRIVGGVNAMKGAWPWMVSLHWNGRHACGASLIDSKWLLTAAHCVYGKNLHLQYWNAVFGLHHQTDMMPLELQTREVDRIFIHKEYNRQTKQADIAMIHLREPVRFSAFVQPVCLPPLGQKLQAGTKCFIAGWGRDSEQGSLPNVLQEAQVPLVPRDQCQLQLPEYTITSSMLCAGYPEGGVDTCQGDSGGPLMYLDHGLWTLAGVTSFGIGCGRPDRPGVYARVSFFTSWIAETRRSLSRLPFFKS